MRYPRVDQIVPHPEDALACCQITEDDAQFLASALPTLPVEDEQNEPVTLDLNGHVAVRARGQNGSEPTEVRLVNSRWTGEPVRINTNRRCLARALGLGFGEIRLFGPNSPVFCQDGDRKYVWMVLDPESSLAPKDSCITVESPASTIVKNPSLPPRRPEVTVSNSNSEPTRHNGHASREVAVPATPTVNAADGDPGAIAQAVALRDALRDAAAKASDLIRALQQEKRQSRQLRSALASLREIQKLGI